MKKSPLKSRHTAILLAIFTGFIGGHKFYTKKALWGVLYLVSSISTIPFLVSLVEAIRWGIMSDEEFDQEVNGTSPTKEEKKKTTPPNSKKFWMLLVAGLFIFMMIASMGNQPTPINVNGTNIREQFSDWNGSHKNLVKYVKSGMNNPDSFEHVETGHWKEDGYIIVDMKFRGENAFGATITDYIKAKISLSGEILQTFK